MLDDTKLQTAITTLTKKDKNLQAVVKKYGPPPLWNREPGFPSLVKIILEQQVSLASAQAAYNKLLDTINPLTPEKFLTLDDTSVKKIVFSRQKTRYCRILAESIKNEELDLDSLSNKDDQTVMKTLTSLKGIGPWTASIYLLMVLLRQDVWPEGDLALLVSMKEVYGLDEIPSKEMAARIADDWKPWRSVAARILWHNYLSLRADKRKGL